MNTMDRPVPQCLTTSGKERHMQPIVRKVFGFVIIAVYQTDQVPVLPSAQRS
jgi:hypothetical protein